MQPRAVVEALSPKAYSQFSGLRSIGHRNEEKEFRIKCR